MEEQIDLFSYTMPMFHIGNRKIMLIELFAGIGSQYKALKNIGANVVPHRCIEIDKYAIASYNAVHGTNFEPTDICTLKGGDLGITNDENLVYLLTYSFP